MINRKIKKTLTETQGVCSKIGIFSSVIFGLLFACATPKLPPPPPKYVISEEKGPQLSANSLWNNSASLYENVQARRLNDLVTINVVESISGSGSANTNAGRNSTIDAGVNNIFGLPLNFNKLNMFGQGNTFSPGVSGSMQDAFKGTGSTDRAGKLVGVITAKVVEVMPNGNLLIESRKNITINNEKQILILRGMVRPDDIALDNTVPSSRVADADIYFVGDGVLQNKQRPGWLVRFLDKVWPF